MSEKRRWEYTRKGNIKTTSLNNARIALQCLDITGTYSREDGEVHVLYVTGRTAQPLGGKCSGISVERYLTGSTSRRHTPRLRTPWHMRWTRRKVPRETVTSREEHLHHPGRARRQNVRPFFCQSTGHNALRAFPRPRKVCLP